MTAALVLPASTASASAAGAGADAGIGAGAGTTAAWDVAAGVAAASEDDGASSIGEGTT